MPNLGPGVDQHVNLTPTPNWVFTPNTSATATVRFYNEGRNICYVGQSGVTPNNGLPVVPGGRPIELQNVTQTLYGCSGWIAGAALATTSTASTAGTTTMNFASGGMASIPVGTTFLVGAGSGQEALVVASSVNTTTITTTTAALFDHVTSSPADTITTAIGQLRVTAGVM